MLNSALVHQDSCQQTETQNVIAYVTDATKYL